MTQKKNIIFVGGSDKYCYTVSECLYRLPVPINTVTLKGVGSGGGKSVLYTVGLFFWGAKVLWRVKSLFFFFFTSVTN